MPRQANRFRRRTFDQQGFTLLELLVSVSIVTLLMAIVFQFMDINQKRYRGQQLMAEVTQGGRSAFEVMTQEINQAGYNPPFRVNKTVGGSSITNPGTGLLAFPIAAGTSPATKTIFYGTRLVIGNNCTGSPSVCNQEEVQVNYDTTYGTTAMTTTSVPLVIANPHSPGEPIFTRNFPYPSGILYNNYIAGTGLGIADNILRFFGDIMDTGDLYYGEYRLQCRGTTAGTYIDACTTGCTEGPFVLTRFLTKLADSSTNVFRIPASKAAAFDGATVSPLVDNIQGSCATGAGTAPADWTVFTAPDETSPTGTTAVNAALSWSGGVASYVEPVLNSDGTPAIWLKLNTYGAWDNSTSPPSPYFQSFVLDVRLTLSVQQSQRDP
ncbi:MAG: prepilin-type N-terminal cleavage/methylation domain-containing protein, partial [Acidobacteria bacterium]|nr:prepilin-type N-terminal cleavage/methylation domain-containing protein [Acidobacteriota bacterium]